MTRTQRWDSAASVYTTLAVDLLPQQDEFSALYPDRNRAVWWGESHGFVYASASCFDADAASCCSPSRFHFHCRLVSAELRLSGAVCRTWMGGERLLRGLQLADSSQERLGLGIYPQIKNSPWKWVISQERCIFLYKWELVPKLAAFGSLYFLILRLYSSWAESWAWMAFYPHMRKSS